MSFPLCKRGSSCAQRMTGGFDGGMTLSANVTEELQEAKMVRYYNIKLKSNSRQLRNNMTDAEILLWSRIRRKQLKGIQFYRQKPIGCYIVDFYAPAAGLVVEIDGGQHFEEKGIQQDKKRDFYLKKQNLIVLRFDNLQVLHFIDDVLDVIFGNI